MKLMRTAITILLFLFVGATVGTLIAQQVARPEPQLIADNDADGPVETSAIPTSEQSTNDVVALPNDLPEVDEVELTKADSPDGSEVGQPVAASAEPESSTVDTSCVIEAVYFHNTHRCVTCLKIEGDAKAIVEEAFAEELAAGTLRWSTINMEDNPSLIVQYNLASPSLVLLRKSGEQVVDWVLLEETWALIRSTTKYSAYIIDSFSAFLEGCQ